MTGCSSIKLIYCYNYDKSQVWKQKIENKQNIEERVTQNPLILMISEMLKQPIIVNVAEIFREKMVWERVITSKI